MRENLWLLLCYYICQIGREGTDTNLLQDWSDSRLRGMKWAAASWEDRCFVRYRLMFDVEEEVGRGEDLRLPLRGNQNQSHQRFTVARRCCHFNVKFISSVLLERTDNDRRVSERRFACNRLVLGVDVFCISRPGRRTIGNRSGIEKRNHQERVCGHFCKLVVMDGVDPPLPFRFDSRLW